MHCCKSLVCRLPLRRPRGRAVFVTWVVFLMMRLNLPGVEDISALTRLDEGGVILHGSLDMFYTQLMATVQPATVGSSPL